MSSEGAQLPREMPGQRLPFHRLRHCGFHPIHLGQVHGLVRRWWWLVRGTHYSHLWVVGPRNDLQCLSSRSKLVCHCPFGLRYHVDLCTGQDRKWVRAFIFSPTWALASVDRVPRRTLDQLHEERIFRRRPRALLMEPSRGWKRLDFVRVRHGVQVPLVASW